MTYMYPVLPAPAVYAAHHKRSHAQLLFLAAAILVVFVVVITLVVVAVRPTTHPCGLTCGPRSGPRLLSASAYQNQQFGYSVEYDSSALSISGQDQNGVQLQAKNGDGEVDFTATPGADTNGAVQNATGNLDSNQFQNMQQIGPVRGAEIGLVFGQGAAYSASFVPPDGSGQAIPVGIVIIAASHNHVTITVTAFSASDTDVRDAPYGLVQGSLFDYPVTNTIWKGGQ